MQIATKLFGVEPTAVKDKEILSTTISNATVFKVVAQCRSTVTSSFYLCECRQYLSAMRSRQTSPTGTHTIPALLFLAGYQ
jgi:hypothetical protein